MAALFPKIYDVIDKNPTKHITLRWSEPSSTEGSSQWDCFLAKPLEPPGALSLLLLHTDPMYELGSVPLKKQILTEHLLQLHERIDKELVGRRYPRKKLQDLLAGESSALSPKTSEILEEALCELFQVQKIHLNRRSKRIAFYPPDLRLWNSERPLIFAEDDNCWSFLPREQKSFVEWILNKEEDGWVIGWPTAEGKFEELKAEIVTRNLSPDGPFKGKKDDASRIVGKAQAVAVLERISMNPAK